MIISHFHRFILVKPRKVAGTTIELTLSPFLERGDLATSIEPDEEKLRRVKDGVKVGSIYRANKFGFIRRLRDHSSENNTLAEESKSGKGISVIVPSSPA